MFISTKRGAQDTALSQAGLELLSREFARTHDLPCMVFTSQAALTANHDRIISKLETHGQLAILATLESSKRHITGFFSQKNQEKIDIYVFDTTGITLPA